MKTPIVRFWPTAGALIDGGLAGQLVAVEVAVMQTRPVSWA